MQANLRKRIGQQSASQLTKKLSLPAHLLSDVLNIVSLSLAAPRLRNLQAYCKGLLHCFSAQRIVFFSSVVCYMSWGRRGYSWISRCCWPSWPAPSWPVLALHFSLCSMGNICITAVSYSLPRPFMDFPKNSIVLVIFDSLIPFQLSQLASICQFSFNPWLTLMHESNRTKNTDVVIEAIESAVERGGGSSTTPPDLWTID